MEVALDIDDLGRLAALMGMNVAEFFGATPQGPVSTPPDGSVTGAYQTSRNPRTGDARITPIRATVETTAASQGSDQDRAAAAA